VWQVRSVKNNQIGGDMAALTGKERVVKMFKKEPIDRMPCFSGQGTVTVQAIEKMGTQFSKIHNDAKLMAGAALTSARLWGLDGLVIPFDMAAVAEAMGRGVSLYDAAEGIIYPTVPNKWKDLDEIDVPEDFMSKGRMPIIDDAFEILKKDAPDLAIGAWVLGPFTLGGQIMELDILLKGLKKKKDQIETFLSEMTKVTIAMCKHYESLGVDFICVREMGSGTDLLSPRMWKTLIGPNLKLVFDSISVPSINHICGSTDMIIEMMHECGADALSVDQKNNLVETREKVGNDVLLLGNFDPYGTLTTMEDTSEVADVIKKCIDEGVDSVWPGCDIWPDVKKENMETYVQTVKEYGVKSTPAVKRI
jgi:[methyl-Co(III) methanol-specific corrinoid protein]:coenzyme M methyltransferase